MIRELFSRISWWSKADRLGPDVPTTHFLLYLPVKAKKLCDKKFKRFGFKSEFRPGAYAVTCSNISIGDYVVIRPSTMLFATKDATIEIEDNVLIGSGVHIYVSNHLFSNPEVDIIHQGHTPGKSVTLKKGCWVGANSILLPGVTIGENAVVGAGSIVTKDVPPRSVAVGNPAKVIKQIDV